MNPSRKNASGGRNLEKQRFKISRKVFENHNLFILRPIWRVERTFRNRFSRIGLSRELPFTLLISGRLGDFFLCLHGCYRNPSLILCGAELVSDSPRLTQTGELGGFGEEFYSSWAAFGAPSRRICRNFPTDAYRPFPEAEVWGSATKTSRPRATASVRGTYSPGASRML